MCISPILHRHLPLAARCELGLAGFLSLDMFQVMATETCARLNAPTGSCWMAPQTQYNLQGTALAAVMICITKDPQWHPWKIGRGRLSELGVEEWFSFLRSQSPNSQLTARSFWQAGAKTQMKHGKDLNKAKPVSFSPEEALTDEQTLGIQASASLFASFFYKVMKYHDTSFCKPSCGCKSYVCVTFPFCKGITSFIL